MPIRNYKYKLYVSKHTRELSSLVTSANFAWNHVVELCRRYYKLYRKSVSPTRLQSHMAKLAKRDRFWSKLHSQTLQNICQKYTEALNQHFKKKGRGFPRFHKPHNKGSILFKGSGGYKLTAGETRGTLVVNKLDKDWEFRFKVTRPWGEVKNVMVKRDTDGCLCLIVCCIVPEERLEREDSGSIGMDFGMKTFLTLSDGSSVAMPDYHKQSLKDIKAADRSYSLKRNAQVYGSSFRRAKKAKAKAHRKAANQRSDCHWKLAHELCRKYSFIAIEDLNLKGMQMHRNWGRKVSSLGYGEFVQKLLVVAEKYGTVVEKISRWEASSQTCSECGHVWKGTKDLSVREWVCPECGCVHDRDVNAARNILRVAMERYTGEGVPQAGSGGKTARGNTAGGGCVEGLPEVPAKNPTT